MGSVGKKLLPLAAIAGTIGLGVATGGFGLAAGAAGAGAASGAAAGATGAGLAAAGATAAAPLAAIAPAAGAFSGVAPVAASAANPGIWGSITSFLAKPAVQIGFSGLSSAFQAGSSFLGSQQAEADAEAQAVYDELALTERERDSQRQLAQVLAAQNNRAGAQGVSANEGSTLNNALSANSQADQDLRLFELENRNIENRKRYAKNRARSGLYGGLAGSLVNFGLDSVKAYGK